INPALNVEFAIVVVANLKAHDLPRPHTFEYRQPKDDPLPDLQDHLSAPNIIGGNGTLFRWYHAVGYDQLRRRVDSGQAVTRRHAEDAVKLPADMGYNGLREPRHGLLI